jgi:hypothetical protein
MITRTASTILLGRTHRHCGLFPRNQIHLLRWSLSHGSAACTINTIGSRRPEAPFGTSKMQSTAVRPSDYRSIRCSLSHRSDLASVFCRRSVTSPTCYHGPDRSDSWWAQAGIRLRIWSRSIYGDGQAVAKRPFPAWLPSRARSQ